MSQLALKIVNVKNKFMMKKDKEGLKKRQGIDKLVIALVLVALGVGLAIIFRNTLYSIMTDALTSLKTAVTNLMSGTVSQ